MESKADADARQIREAEKQLRAAHRQIRSADDELKESERMFRHTFELAAVGIAHVAPDGSWLRVNNRLCEIVGYTREELLARTFQDITHPDDLTTDLGHVAQVIAGEIRNYSIRKRYMKKGGSIVWVNLTVALVRDGNNEPEYFISIVDDVSKVVKAEEDLTASTAHLRIRNRIAEVFLRGSDEEMYHDVLRIVLEAVDSRFGAFGYIDEKGDLVVPSMSRRIWEECQVPEKTVVFPRDTWGDSIWPRAIREKRTLFSNSPSTKTPKGHVAISRNIAHPLIHKGEAIGILQVANRETDYTDADVEILEGIGAVVAPILSARLNRDRYQKELIELNAELEERVKERTAELEAFAYSVSHDLRAPLRAIDGFSRAVVEDYHEVVDEAGKDYLERIRAGAQRMGRLIDDLLRLSRLSRAEMAPSRLDLSRLALETLEELRAADAEREVETVIASGVEAVGDRELLRSVLGNLLGNAWKFTAGRERARIEFGVDATGREPAFYVRDNGAGFDMQYADRLFGVFQRLHDSTEFPGTGIGLATVKRVVARHGGRTWGEGAVGQGATFYFTLPGGNRERDRRA